MRFLFFFVHPSKFHLFRITINQLLANGHCVELYISGKDVLEDLVKKEGWNYTNIFPKGRKIKGAPPLISAVINFFRTIWRLYKNIKNIKYDLFITDDVLGIIGKLKKVPTIHFVDDDVSIIPVSSFLLKFVSHILAPNSTNLGKYERKKIGFEGLKQSAYLRPEQFHPDIKIIDTFNPDREKYYIIRLVALNATHDIGKSGISDNLLDELLPVLENNGRVFITSERRLKEKYEKYRLKINPNEIMHILFFAQILICDSQSMSAEAGMLGTPFIRFNDFVDKIGCLKVLEMKYNLGFGIRSKEKEKLFTTVRKLIAAENLKEEWEIRRNKMLSETIDLSKFMIWLFENYPQSVDIIKLNPNYQY